MNTPSEPHEVPGILTTQEEVDQWVKLNEHVLSRELKERIAARMRIEALSADIDQARNALQVGDAGLALDILNAVAERLKNER